MTRSKVLILILIVVLIILGVELIGAKSFSSHPQSIAISTSSPHVAQTDWSTCTNSYGGYSFRYPSSWHVLKSGDGAPMETDCEDAGANFSINPIDPNNATSSYGGDYTAGSIQFYFTKGAELAEAPKSLDDFFIQNPTILHSNKFLMTGAVGGEKAVWVQDEPKNWFVDIYLCHDGNIIDITADKVNDPRLLNGVLDSFKFDR